MRKLLPLLSALLLLGGCKKDAPVNAPSAYFDRSINGSSVQPWNFYGPDQVSLTQSQDGSAGRPHSRWTITLHSANVAVSLTFPGKDTSRMLPCEKLMSFGYRSSQPATDSFKVNVHDAGALYDGPDSSFLSVTFSLFDKLATGGFTASLYGPTGLYVITSGSFANIPITFAQ
jgi:hypothetical protein